MVSSIADDESHMRHALRLAERSLGRVAPNPAVGCVIISKNGVVTGRGWTGAGGRPHAETLALQQAGERAKGGTAYVTLEPCAHHGVTPPSALATRVVTSGGNPLNAAIAGGILTIGESHGGAMEKCAKILQEWAAKGDDMNEIAEFWKMVGVGALILLGLNFLGVL